MATGFPGSIDVNTDPTATSAMNNPSHAGLHANMNDAMAAVQAGGLSDSPAAIANVLGQTFPDWHATGAVYALTSGTTFLSRINIQAGVKITNIWFHSGGAGSTITHMWAGLLDKTLVSPVLLANSPDTLATVGTVAASTPISYTLTTPFTTTYSGLYYLLLVITASTQPTWNCAPSQAATGRAVTAPIIGGPGMTSVTTVASYTQVGSIVPSSYVAPLLGYLN